MEMKPVAPETRAPELRRTILVPLFSSALVVILSWTGFVLSFYPKACQLIYESIERDFETSRYVFGFTGVLFTCFFIFSWRAWRKART
jgi:hypothetical protein